MLKILIFILKLLGALNVYGFIGAVITLIVLYCIFPTQFVGIADKIREVIMDIVDKLRIKKVK